MLLEDVINAAYILGLLMSFIALGISLRTIIPAILIDINLQKIEQEEIELEQKMLNLPENVVPFERWSYSEPFKEFVEDFAFFEQTRALPDRANYAFNRIRMIRKARRLLKKQP